MKGAAKLRAVLTGEGPVTPSALERRFLALLGEHELPLPRTNRLAGARRVDCRREREADARGDQLRRYTYADVLEAPRLMLTELVALLRES